MLPVWFGVVVENEVLTELVELRFCSSMIGMKMVIASKCMEALQGRAISVVLWFDRALLGS